MRDKPARVNLSTPNTECTGSNGCHKTDGSCTCHVPQLSLTVTAWCAAITNAGARATQTTRSVTTLSIANLQARPLSHRDQNSKEPQRLIVGISGASGVLLGIRALELLQKAPVETHLVISKATALTVASETDLRLDDIKALADQVHSVSDIAASISSGSYRTMGMLITPCSIKTMGEIASGVTSTLLTRAADVVLKERRRLVLMLRETPLHAGHLRNALAVTEMGAIIAPPVPAFYTRPKTIDDVVNQSVSRALDLFDIDTGSTQRWGEDLGLQSC